MGTVRGPVLKSGSRSSRASSRTSSQRSVRISLGRQTVSAAGGSPTPREPNCRRRPPARPARRRAGGASATRHAGGPLDRPIRGGDRFADGCGNVAQSARKVRHMPPPDRETRRTRGHRAPCCKFATRTEIFAPTSNRDRPVNSIRPSLARSGPFNVGGPRPGWNPEIGARPGCAPRGIRPEHGTEADTAVHRGTSAHKSEPMLAATRAADSFTESRARWA